MYQKYLVLLELEENRNYKKAREMSLREIRNRPSPQSYDLLAWTHFKKGEINEALKIASRYVEHKTFEPEAAYHLGMIYMSVGNKRLGRHYLQEALTGAHELGPVIERSIREII